jgi:hypothetical protein
MPMVFVEHDSALIWKTIAYQMNIILNWNNYFLFILFIVHIWIQSLYLNRITTKYNMFPKPSYLAAYTFILLTSLLPEWNVFNIYTLGSWLLLLLLNNILKIYNQKDATITIINMGVVLGIMGILYFPNLLFIFLALMGLASLRAFKPKEWIAFFLGITVPYYLFFSYTFLFEKEYLNKFLLQFEINLIHHINPNQIASLVLIFITCIIGFVGSNKLINRMVIEGKKYWNVIFTFFCINCVSWFITLNNDFSGILITLLPISIIACGIYYEPIKKWISNVVAFAILIFTFLIQWL